MTTTHKITAFDPGITTGIAIRMSDGTIFTRAETELPIVYSFVIKSGIVVYEDFTTAGRISTYGLHTVRLVGAIIALCHISGIPCIRHMPYNRKAFQLPAHKLLSTTKHLIHEEDALAHLLAYEKTGK